MGTPCAPTSRVELPITGTFARRPALRRHRMPGRSRACTLGPGDFLQTFGLGSLSTPRVAVLWGSALSERSMGAVSMLVLVWARSCLLNLLPLQCGTCQLPHDPPHCLDSRAWPLPLGVGDFLVDRRPQGGWQEVALHLFVNIEAVLCRWRWQCACLGWVLHEVLLLPVLAAAPCNFLFADTGISAGGLNNACPPLTYLLDRGPWPRCWGCATGLLCRHFGTQNPATAVRTAIFTSLALCLPAALLLLSVVCYNALCWLHMSERSSVLAVEASGTGHRPETPDPVPGSLRPCMTYAAKICGHPCVAFILFAMSEGSMVRAPVWSYDVVRWSDWLQASIAFGLLSFQGLLHLSLCPCMTHLLSTPTKNCMPTDTTSNTA